MGPASIRKSMHIETGFCEKKPPRHVTWVSDPRYSQRTMRWLCLTCSDIMADAPSTPSRLASSMLATFNLRKKPPTQIPDDPRSPNIQSCLQGCALPKIHSAARCTSSECPTDNFESMGDRGRGLFSAEPGIYCRLYNMIYYI